MSRVISWRPGLDRLGPSVVAIGVFDGVHRGHQALLADAAREARRTNVLSVALTFDRDPDQIVTPHTAAAQLLTLDDKCRFIIECGIAVVLVVPFTAQIATTPPEEFLDDVLGSCCDVTAVHVGRDFRFGAKAAGDIDTLYVWGVEHGAAIRPHRLVSQGHQPVSSTRIRGLVAEGKVAEAAELLGRPTRIDGSVQRGRGQGAGLGFATANLAPVRFAAVPGDGVYAGRALLGDGSSWPAAISIGVPPTFPEARDYVEAHLIGFEGDLYGATITLEFHDKLRDHRTFGSNEELSAAIARDVSAASERVKGPQPASPAPHLPPDDAGVDDPLSSGIEDPTALEQAERLVARLDPMDAYADRTEPWVALFGPTKLSSYLTVPARSALALTAPLEAAGIAHRWDPYPPELMPLMCRADSGAVDRTFTLQVHESNRDEAADLLLAGLPQLSPSARQELAPALLLSDEAQRFMAVRVGVLLVIMLAVQLGSLLMSQFVYRLAD